MRQIQTNYIIKKSYPQAHITSFDKQEGASTNSTTGIRRVDSDIVDNEASDAGINKQEVHKEALKEVLKEDIVSATKTREAVKKLMEVSPRSLFTTKAVFPFQFFPDSLSIEETRVNIITKQFFYTQHLTAIGIENIIDVSVQTSIVFATLHITSRMYVQNVVEPFEINFLKKRDAIKARNIIEGLRIMTAKSIDTTKIAVNELINEVEELGRANGLAA